MAGSAIVPGAARRRIGLGCGWAVVSPGATTGAGRRGSALHGVAAVLGGLAGAPEGPKGVAAFEASSDRTATVPSPTTTRAAPFACGSSAGAARTRAQSTGTPGAARAHSTTSEDSAA